MKEPFDGFPVVADPGDDDLEIIGGVGIVAIYWRHDVDSSLYSLADCCLVYCWMRKMTNSAGLTGSDADQADQSPVVDVVLRHRRLVAFDEVRLCRGRPLQRPAAPVVVRKSPIVCRIRAHSGSSFGSNTTHCVPSSIEAST